jgi:hypothetical protein
VRYAVEIVDRPVQRVDVPRAARAALLERTLLRDDRVLAGKAQRIADTITVSDSRSASDTRSVWLDFASTPVASPSKLWVSCRPAARAASIATAIGSCIPRTTRAGLRPWDSPASAP